MANAWLSFLAGYRKKHPSKSMKQCMKDAAVDYKKQKKGGAAKKKVKKSKGKKKNLSEK